MNGLEFSVFSTHFSIICVHTEILIAISITKAQVIIDILFLLMEILRLTVSLFESQEWRLDVDHAGVEELSIDG